MDRAGACRRDVRRSSAASSHHNVTLRDVAAEVVLTGGLVAVHIGA
jgi:hypothetical protein